MPITDDCVIFISGCGHSGTTVLSAIMDSHPKIYTVRRETNWFNNYQCNDLIIRQEYEFEKNKEEPSFLQIMLPHNIFNHFYYKIYGTEGFIQHGNYKCNKNISFDNILMIGK